MAASQVKVMNQKLEKIDGAVKVCDSRRKQKWIRTPTPIPPTPPGSPSVLPEPLLDELLELWVGVGMDEPSYKQHDISLKSALDSLEFDDEDTFHIVGEYGGDSDTGNENEELLNRLLDRHHFDDSPPPTNPASPREFRDQEVEIQSEEEAYTTVATVETEYFNTVEEEELTETVVCSVIEDEGEEDAVEMDLEEFDAFPKTEPITSEFSSHFFDSYFDSAFPDLEERTTGLMAEEVEEEEMTTTMIEEETIPMIDNSETISSIINYGKPNNFNDEVEIKHDCMWAGSCESDSHQKDFEELFGTSLAPRIDSSFYGDDDHYGDVIQATTSSPQEEEQEMDEELDEIDTNLEVLRSKILGDHSYAFSGYGPVHQNTQSSSASNTTSSQSNSQSAASVLSLSSTAQTTHTIPPGIGIKQEESSSPKKTKIIVPLKDLMETLKQKSFYVSPGGPGKSVIRLTGNGETFKGIMSSAVGLALNGSTTFTTANGSKASFSVKKSNPKLKKAIHKPKQELSSCQSSTNSSRTTTTSSLGFSLQQSNGSCNSNSSSNSHNSGCSLTSSSSSIHSSSASSPNSSLSSNPSGKPRKTKTHNNMERMRRIDLRNSFDTLRKLVPVLTKANKCSKVEILKSATEYINGLKLIEKKISKEEQALRSRNEALRTRLAALTSTST